jgi:hypothetical protein
MNYLMQKFQRLYDWIFRIKRYRRLEMKRVTYAMGDQMVRESAGKPEHEQWVLAIPEEDHNRMFGIVYLERRERINP